MEENVVSGLLCILSSYCVPRAVYILLRTGNKTSVVSQVFREKQSSTEEAGYLGSCLTGKNFPRDHAVSKTTFIKDRNLLAQQSGGGLQERMV